MKWFKHDSDAMLDSKLQRVRMKYGMEGYGLYWFLLECIARNVDQNNLTFELEEDSEIIAAMTGIHRERIEETMRYMVDLRLFESAEGTVTCLKMATRTDEYTQKIIRSISGHTPDNIRLIRTEQNRTEQKDIRGRGARKRFTPPTVEQVTEYCREKGYRFDPEYFVAHHQARGWKLRGGQLMKCWKSACTTFEKNRLKFDGPAGGSDPEVLL